MIAGGAATMAMTAPTLGQPAPGTTLVTGLSTSAQDIAALVERLVEARNAAAPQAVEATITHGEFGRVGLRFAQDAGALSVAMTSADPGFAPAVQAAAASVPSGLMQDTGSAPQRQDGRPESTGHQQQGHAASTGSGQSQAQSQQAARREDGFRPAAGTTHTETDDAPSGPVSRRAGSGIYA